MDERVAHDTYRRSHDLRGKRPCADTDDQEVLAIRAKFEELYSKFWHTETDAAAEKVRAGRRSVYPGTERHESR